MSNVSKRRREGSRSKIKSMGDHEEFLKRITKTLYYGELPALPCLSLPVTELSCALWSALQAGRSLRRLHGDAAARLARGARVSPCALVLALLYLERLRHTNPDYLAATAPADLFLVSLMVGNKFLQDDGEDAEVLSGEWAAAGGLARADLHRLEIDFLNAIEWNVYVNSESFESGLAWLERRVALKQARSRGFFTYGDLAAAGGGARAELAAAGAAAAGLALAYVAALGALLAGALLAAAALRLLHAPAPAPALDPAPPANATLAFTLDAPAAGAARCCTDWLRYREAAEPERERALVSEWAALEPWWFKTSLLTWLYRSSLVDPEQRWLEKLDGYADLFSKLPEPEARCGDRSARATRPRCMRLGALVMISDR